MIMNLVIDKLNDYQLRSTPVFSNPVYLSVPVSLAIVLICGKLGAIIAMYITLPAIIGYLFAGLAIQNIINPMVLKGPGFPFPSVSSELKLIALIIVLMRAGLSIKFNEMRANSISILLLCIVPYYCEFLLWLFVGSTVFDWDLKTAGLMGSIMAPLGPSVVISTILSLLSNMEKQYGCVPQLVLNAAPIEAVISIVLFGIFGGILQTESNPLFPWVKPMPLYASILVIPAMLLFSTALGMIVGWVSTQYINWRAVQRTDYIWVRVSKNPQMGGSTADLVFVLVVLSYLMINLCTPGYIQQASGVLVVYIALVTASQFLTPELAVDIAGGLKGIWTFAEVFLFTFTGTSLTFDASNGPLYGQRGLTRHQIGVVFGIMVAGMAARFVGIMISALIAFSTWPSHRKTFYWYSRFCLSTGLFQMPKATVQATMGAVAYTTHLIPGAEGQNEALFIAQATAFTVLIFAPLGTFLIKAFGAPLALDLEAIDIKAGWDSKNNCPFSAVIAKEIVENDDSGPASYGDVDSNGRARAYSHSGVELVDMPTLVDAIIIGTRSFVGTHDSHEGKKNRPSSFDETHTPRARKKSSSFVEPPHAHASKASCSVEGSGVTESATNYQAVQQTDDGAAI